MLQYSIHLASVAFLETNRYKIRPVVVLTEPTGAFQTVLVAPIYSQQLSDQLASDIMILQNFSDYGLVRPSTIRLHRITELPLTDLKEQLGAVPAPDRAKLQTGLKSMFRLV
jgi:mRNA-degrading endonuclease toxin of MazEF toxin-antitoxin module